MAIIRKTYGFNKKTDIIPLSQFCQITRMDQKSVCRVLKSLFYKMVITVKKDNFGNIYGIQKDYDKWIVGGRIASGESATGGVASHTGEGVASHTGEGVAKSPHSIDNRQKTTEIFTLEEEIRTLRMLGYGHEKMKNHFKKIQKREDPEIDRAISKEFEVSILSPENTKKNIQPINTEGVSHARNIHVQGDSRSKQCSDDVRSNESGPEDSVPTGQDNEQAPIIEPGH